MNWLKKIFTSESNVKLKEKAENVNDIPAVEITRMYKLACIAMLTQGKTAIKFESRDFDPKSVKVVLTKFVVDPKYGSSSEMIMCADLNDCINRDFGHSTVFDLKGNGVNVHHMTIHKDIALSILLDKDISKKIRDNILLMSIRQFAEARTDKNFGYHEKMEDYVFTYNQEFLETAIIKLYDPSLKLGTRCHD